MKVWFGYGSEHSYSMVMIGRFVDAAAASAVALKFQRLRQVAETELGEPTWDARDSRLNDQLVEVLREMELYNLHRGDVENFVYDHDVEVRGSELVLRTDEGEVQGFLKVLINAGAKIEVYSAHNWNDDGTPATVEDEAGAEGVGGAAESS